VSAHDTAQKQEEVKAEGAVAQEHWQPNCFSWANYYWVAGKACGQHLCRIAKGKLLYESTNTKSTTKATPREETCIVKKGLTHPLWLTFHNEDMEKEFAKGQHNQRTRRTFTLAVWTVAYALASLCMPVGSAFSASDSAMPAMLCFCLTATRPEYAKSSTEYAIYIGGLLGIFTVAALTWRPFFLGEIESVLQSVPKSTGTDAHTRALIAAVGGSQIRGMGMIFCVAEYNLVNAPLPFYVMMVIQIYVWCMYAISSHFLVDELVAVYFIDESQIQKYADCVLMILGFTAVVFVSKARKAEIARRTLFLSKKHTLDLEQQLGLSFLNLRGH